MSKLNNYLIRSSGKRLVIGDVCVMNEWFYKKVLGSHSLNAKRGRIVCKQALDNT